MERNAVHTQQIRNLLTQPDAFSRENEADDALFYTRPRMVQHLDSTALETVAELIGALAVREHPDVLDLMASIDTHLPDSFEAGRVAGLGMNADELAANPKLDERVVHDLNATPTLPFPDNSFDIVLNTLSVQYLTHPVEIFREVNRVLRDGGLHLVIFSNRTFAPKAVTIWTQLTESERLELLRIYFADAGGFTQPDTFIVMGRPRPHGDKYESTGVPSDPVYAVYAEKGDPASHADRRHAPPVESEHPDHDEIERRKAEFVHTGKCPYCGEPMHLWAVTENPMTTWNHDFYVCINDECPYVVRGWRVMYEQGNPGLSYRLCFDPVSKTFSSLSVPSLSAIKSQIKDEVYEPEE